jgi:alpha-galactosidase/6-phospho-beta-glucosidase family protein
MKSAFVNLCLPDWQQEFLKTGINECSSTWDDILSKAEAMEQAQNATTEASGTSINKENKREHEEGEVDADSSPKASPKKKAKSAFCCKLHGYGQNHNTDQCEILNAEFKNSKQTGDPKPFPVNYNKSIPTINNPT